MSLEMPNLNLGVIPCRCDNSVFLIEPDARYKMIMCILNLLFLLPEVQVPNTDTLVIGCAIQVLSCRMETE